ncbi:MAG: domain S-box protein [Herminiimonas sp.]|nr:domain S-box protein [Herminiimonas sp.]
MAFSSFDNSVGSRFTFAVGISVLAVALEWTIQQWVGTRIPFLFFLPAIVLTAILAGSWPASMVLAIGAINATALLTPEGQLSSMAMPDRAPMLAYLGTGALLVLLGGYLRQVVRRAEHAERRLEVALENTGVGLFEVDLVNRTIFASATLWKLLGRMPPDGYKNGFMPLDDWNASLSPEELNEERRLLKEVAAKGATGHEREHLVALPGGQHRWLLTKIHFVRDGNGRVLRLHGASLDITERKHMNMLLEQAQGELKQQVAEWQHLHELSSRLLRPGPVPDQAHAILETVAAFHSSRQGLISVYEPAVGGLVIHASLGITDSGLEQMTCVPVGSGAIGLAFAEKHRVIIEDTETDPRFTRYRALAREQGFRAVYSTPFFGASGQVIGAVSVYFPEPRRPSERELRLSDIYAGSVALFIERMRAEVDLHIERDRSHQILQSMGEGFILLDRNYGVLQINAEAMRHDRRPVSEIIGRSHWDAWPGSEQSVLGQLYRHAMSERLPAISLEHSDTYSSIRGAWMEVRAYPFGEGLAIFYRDVTERKKAEVGLRESEARYRTLTETISLVVWRANAEGAMYAENPSWAAFTGQTTEQYRGSGWFDAVHMDDRANALAAWYMALAARKPYEAAYRLRRHDGQYRDIISRGVAVTGPDGEVVEWVGNCTDVTDANLVEKVLRDANRRKDEFLAMLAHELRNPLAPISMAAQILKLPGIDEKRIRDTSEIVSRQVGHMVSLVNDLLDVSRVTRGLVTLGREPLDLETVVDGAVEQVRSLIESRRHRLTIMLTPEPVRVMGDRTRLVQVIANLLNNAAKYTPEGGEITLRTETQSDQVALSVCDNGVGISSELRPFLFELFTQGERSSDRSQGGLGLGLALVKSLVELQGGSVEAYSDGTGKGSKFTIRLPRLFEAAQPDAHVSDVRSSRPQGKPLRIMVVDDNIDAAHTLAVFLEALGHEVSIKYDARSALERALIDAPRVLVLDIGLPDMDGYELALRLRAAPETAHSILIALTGYGQARDQERSKAAGFDYHLIKPADTGRLAALLAQIDLGSPHSVLT